VRLWSNPGTRLEIVAEVALEQVGEDHVVVDVESGKLLTLAEVMRAFREDAAGAEIGWVRITVEPHERGLRRRRG
jgi:hypothetical protein